MRVICRTCRSQADYYGARQRLEEFFQSPNLVSDFALPNEVVMPVFFSSGRGTVTYVYNTAIDWCLLLEKACKYLGVCFKYRINVSASGDGQEDIYGNDGFTYMCGKKAPSSYEEISSASEEEEESDSADNTDEEEESDSADKTDEEEEDDPSDKTDEEEEDGPAGKEVEEDDDPSDKTEEEEEDDPADKEGVEPLVLSRVVAKRIKRKLTKMHNAFTQHKKRRVERQARLAAEAAAATLELNNRIFDMAINVSVSRLVCMSSAGLDAFCMVVPSFAPTLRTPWGILVQRAASATIAGLTIASASSEHLGKSYVLVSMYPLDHPDCSIGPVGSFWVPNVKITKVWNRKPIQAGE